MERGGRDRDRPGGSAGRQPLHLLPGAVRPRGRRLAPRLAGRAARRAARRRGRGGGRRPHPGGPGLAGSASAGRAVTADLAPSTWRPFWKPRPSGLRCPRNELAERRPRQGWGGDTKGRKSGGNDDPAGP